MLDEKFKEEIKLMNELFIDLCRNNKNYSNIKFSHGLTDGSINVDFSRFYKIQKIKKILNKINNDENIH